MDVHRMTNGSDSFNNSHRKHFPDGSIKKEPTNHVSPLKEDRTNLHHKVKNEPIDNEEDDIPLSKRLTKAKAEQGIKRSFVEDDDSEDDLPLAARLEAKKAKKEPKTPDSVKKEKSEFKTPESVKKEKKRKVKEDSDYDEDDEDDIPLSKRKKHKEKEKRKEKNEKKSEDHKEHKEHHKKKHHKSNSKEASQDEKPKKKKKKGEEQEEVWRWWEEESYNDGRKWTTLTHRGPVFAPPYEPLPSDIHFKYDGKVIRLSPDTEEIMGFYAKMLDHDYTTKERFNKNFFHDWRQAMTHDERKMITDLKKCDFKEAHQYFLKKSEERKNITKEEKLKIKEENERLKKEYGHCIVDSHKQLIGNYKIEPPGLFRGRGDHPKMGMVKKRIQPGDVTINVGTNDKIPDPPSGHKWKEVRHDNTVTWLACWTENIQGSNKYVMLNAASRLKGERDWQKYEKARKLHALVDKIRTQYIGDWKSREMRIRQRAVALYFIDRLALRAGNEKDEDEADTVGCCSLRVEHMKLHDESQLVEFDFLGKDSIRYQNAVPVDKRVFKNLKLFVENKQPSDELFDRLNTSLLNQYLQEWMEGLTAKVFRTYNASKTLQEQLDLLTDPDDSIPNKILSYNRANRRVALLCNHQRSVPKTHEKSMENLKKKIDEKREAVRDAERERKAAKSDYKHSKSVKAKQNLEKKKNAVDRIKEQLVKLEVQATDKEENKEIALGTSKLNYLDPRITVAWCKKWEVPIEKIYSKTQRDKFQWALDMATAEFRFYEKPNKLDAELGSPRSSMDGKSSGEKVSGKSSGEKSISEKVSGSKSSGEKVSSKSSGEKVMNTSGSKSSGEKVMNTSGSKSSGEKVNTSGSKSSGEKVSSKSSGEKVNRKPSMEKANSSFKEGNDKTSTPKPARPSDGGKSSAEKPKSEPKKPTDGKPSHKEEKRAEKNSNHSGHSNNVEKQHLDR